MTTTDSPSVLVVDDEEPLVELYARYLESRYTVQTATSGEQAVTLADDSLDVVLLDRRMPKMDGDEVLRALREDGVNAQVAMLTAVEPKASIVEMPFDDYRLKPVDKADILGLVEVLVERNKYDEQSQEFFALAAKRATLQTAGKTDTEAYAELTEKLEATRERIDASLDKVGAEAAFADLAADD